VKPAPGRVDCFCLGFSFVGWKYSTSILPKSFLLPNNGGMKRECFMLPDCSFAIFVNFAGETVCLTDENPVTCILLIDLSLIFCYFVVCELISNVYNFVVILNHVPNLSIKQP